MHVHVHMCVCACVLACICMCMCMCMCSTTLLDACSSASAYIIKHLKFPTSTSNVMNESVSCNDLA